MGKKTLAVLIYLASASGLLAQIDPWMLEADQVDPANYAGVTIANGQIGVVSSPHPFQVKEVVMAGAYDQYGRGMVSNMLRSFNLLNMFLEVDRHRIGPGNVRNMQQELHMKEAYFKSTFDFEDKVTVSVTYRTLRHLKFSVLMNIEVKAKQDFMMNTGSVMSAPDALRDVRNDHTEITIPETTLALLTSSAKSPSGKLDITASNAFIFEEKPGDEPEVMHEMWDDNMHLMKFSKPLKKGEVYRFSVVGSQVTSAHQHDPFNEAQRLTIFAALQGTDKLVDEHTAAWAELWASGDIEIQGDAQTQQDMRNMLYHLYSFVREGSGYSLSPMGLSGLSYNGHVFWDTEIWMFPPLLLLQPQLARGLLDYRFDRLDAAKENAENHGFEGAMFPWESAATGEEETPIWALSGPYEHHISACIAIATWQYYAVTQDLEWLKARGWPILSATAQFWKSRVTPNEAGGYDINNVVGADEWAENVDNDAWTNAAAKANLRYATLAAELIGEAPDPDWVSIAEGIPILRFEDGTTREHATYDGEPVKQADVNLIAYPLKEVTDKETIKKDMIYYRDKIPDIGTPAMTKSIFALLYARLGEAEQAYKVFMDGYRPNMWGPFRVIMETPRSYNPYFATAAGGVLQAMMMGFGGLEITPTGINQLPSQLPKAWNKIIIKGVGVNEETFEVKR